MSKYIGTATDRFGNNIYVVGYNKSKCEVYFDIDKMDSILLTADDKKVINKILRKDYSWMDNLVYIKLEKWNYLTHTASDILQNYDDSDIYDFIEDLNRNDYRTLGCIDLAKSSDLYDIKTFKEFGKEVAKRLIIKYDLKLKKRLI